MTTETDCCNSIVTQLIFAHHSSRDNCYKNKTNLSIVNSLIRLTVIYKRLFIESTDACYHCSLFPISLKFFIFVYFAC